MNLFIVDKEGAGFLITVIHPSGCIHDAQGNPSIAKEIPDLTPSILFQRTSRIQVVCNARTRVVEPQGHGTFEICRNHSVSTIRFHKRTYELVHFIEFIQIEVSPKSNIVVGGLSKCKGPYQGSA